MNIPHINVTLPEIEEDITTIIQFALPQDNTTWDWSSSIWTWYPTLARKLKPTQSREEQETIIRNYLRQYYHQAAVL